MATGTRGQKHSEEQMALLMQMMTEGQQQQQLIAQKQRAWREELVKEQRAQKDRQTDYRNGKRTLHRRRCSNTNRS